MEGEIINKVAASGLITIDLEEFYDKRERLVYDLKHNLFHELILKEKDFRQFLKEHDWNNYAGKNVSVVCTADAIIPTWAYMLIVSRLVGLANHVVVGDQKALDQSLLQIAIGNLNIEKYRGAKVVVKGCGDFGIDVYAYGEITRKLVPVVSSIMYGEPCSTVPVFKAKS